MGRSVRGLGRAIRTHLGGDILNRCCGKIFERREWPCGATGSRSQDIGLIILAIGNLAGRFWRQGCGRSARSVRMLYMT